MILKSLQVDLSNLITGWEPEADGPLSTEIYLPCCVN